MTAWLPRVLRHQPVPEQQTTDGGLQGSVSLHRAGHPEQPILRAGQVCSGTPCQTETQRITLEVLRVRVRQVPAADISDQRAAAAGGLGADRRPRQLAEGGRQERPPLQAVLPHIRKGRRGGGFELGLGLEL